MTATQSKRNATPEREALPGVADVLGPMYPPAIKWDNPGDVHTLCLEGSGSEQDRDYNTGDPIYWEDGRPKYVLALYGELVDGEGDGTWWVRGRRAERALRTAMREAKVGELAKGDLVSVVRGPDEEVPAKKKGDKPMWANTYEVTITPAGSGK